MFIVEQIVCVVLHFKVKRLVLVETEEMFKARKQKEANHRELCPPLVVNHLPGLATDSS